MCLGRSPTGSLPFNQQKGEKSMEELTGEVFMGQAWKHHAPHPLVSHCETSVEWPLLTAREAGKCGLAECRRGRYGYLYILANSATEGNMIS